MRTALVVFGREPVPGRVKTRLAAEIGVRGAARVYENLLEHTLEIAARSGLDLVVSLAEEPSAGWREGHEMVWEVQRGDDLGARMQDAFDRRFGEGFGRVLVIGSDCAGLYLHHLRQAEEALEKANVALGPTSDGGYWLVAQRRPGVDLFSGVPWSSQDTLAATRQKLETLEQRWVELGELDDIDTESDLRAALTDAEVAKELRERLLDALEE